MRTQVLFAAMAIGAGVMLPSAAAAQAPIALRPAAVRGIDDLKIGAKLRVSSIANPLEHLEGRFAGVRGSTMTLQLRGSERRELSIADLYGMEEAYRDRWRGALVGVLPGIVGVYVWDFFGPHPRYADQHLRYRENILALAITTGAGALLGAAIGWERWRSVHTIFR